MKTLKLITIIISSLLILNYVNCVKAVNEDKEQKQQQQQKQIKKEDDDKVVNLNKIIVKNIEKDLLKNNDDDIDNNENVTTTDSSELMMPINHDDSNDDDGDKDSDNNDENNDDELQNQNDNSKRVKKSTPITTVCVEIKPTNPYDEPYFMCKGSKAQIPASLYQQNKLQNPPNSLNYLNNNSPVSNYGVNPYGNGVPNAYNLNPNSNYQPPNNNYAPLSKPSSNNYPGGLNSYGLSHQQQPALPLPVYSQANGNYGNNRPSLIQPSSYVAPSRPYSGLHTSALPQSYGNRPSSSYGRTFQPSQDPTSDFAYNNQGQDENMLQAALQAPDGTSSMNNNERTFHKLKKFKGHLKGGHDSSSSEEYSGEDYSHSKHGHGYNNYNNYNGGYGYGYGGHLNHGYNNYHNGYGGYGYGGHLNYGYNHYNKGYGYNHGYSSYGRANDDNYPTTSEAKNDGNNNDNLQNSENGVWAPQSRSSISENGALAPQPQSSVSENGALAPQSRSSYSPASVKTLLSSYGSPLPTVSCGTNLLISCQPYVASVPCAPSPNKPSYVPLQPAAVPPAPPLPLSRPVVNYRPQPVQPSYVLPQPAYRAPQPVQPVIYYELGKPQQNFNQDDSQKTSKIDETTSTKQQDSTYRMSDDQNQLQGNNDRQPDQTQGKSLDAVNNNQQNNVNDNQKSSSQTDGKNKKLNNSSGRKNPSDQNPSDPKKQIENVQNSPNDTMMKMAQMEQMITNENSSWKK